jgi:tetratricopeptide (TPR) repeat protein
MAGAEGLPSGFALRYGGAQLFALRREQGRLDEMEGPMRALAAQHPDNRGWRAALAFMYAELGREVEARAELEAVSASGLVSLPRDHNWLITLSFLGQASATLGEPDRADAIYRLLTPFAERVVVVTPGIACIGSVSHVLAVLATTLGRYDAAEKHFADAIATNTRLGAVPFVAHTQREWAAMLTARGDHARAGELVRQAADTYERLGMPARGLDRPAAAGNVFARSGDQWTLAYDGRLVRLRHGKGLGYLAELLRHPGRHLHVIDLAGAPGFHEGDATPRPDPEARAAYRRRVEDLRAELADAEAGNDLGMTVRLRDELEALGAELAVAYGFGNASLRSQGPADRVRKAVTKCIREDIARIGRHHESLARHLANAVRTGTFCVYIPERPTVWDG